MFGGFDLFVATTWILPVLFAITFHEAAHGFAAWRLGDPTAYQMGRVTANPLKHVDPFGTVILPLMLFLASSPFMFGWAKPVPVNFMRLRSPRRDMVLVAAAGPASNIVMALMAALSLHLMVYIDDVTVREWMGSTLVNGIVLNVLLAVFNMLPLPPLDGGRVAVGVLPRSLALPLAGLERYGILILLGLLVVLPMLGNLLGVSLNIFGWVVLPVVDALINVITDVTGL